ncbi:MAG: hypothetical protein ACYCSF_12965 [Acidimicrobiales bacterium]
MDEHEAGLERQRDEHQTTPLAITRTVRTTTNAHRARYAAVTADRVGASL